MKLVGTSVEVISYVVSRYSLFDDVMSMYHMQLKDFETEYSFCVKFSREKVIDTGSVVHDVFSAFLKIPT